MLILIKDFSVQDSLAPVVSGQQARPSSTGARRKMANEIAARSRPYSPLKMPYGRVSYRLL